MHALHTNHFRSRNFWNCFRFHTSYSFHNCLWIRSFLFTNDALFKNSFNESQTGVERKTEGWKRKGKKSENLNETTQENFNKKYNLGTFKLAWTEFAIIFLFSHLIPYLAYVFFCLRIRISYTYNIHETGFYCSKFISLLLLFLRESARKKTTNSKYYILYIGGIITFGQSFVYFLFVLSILCLISYENK